MLQRIHNGGNFRHTQPDLIHRNIGEVQHFAHFALDCKAKTSLKLAAVMSIYAVELCSFMSLRFDVKYSAVFQVTVNLLIAARNTVLNRLAVFHEPSVTAMPKLNIFDRSNGCFKHIEIKLKTLGEDFLRLVHFQRR